MNETVFTTSLIILEIIFSLMVLKALCSAGAKKLMLATIGIFFMAWLATDYYLISTGFFSATGMPQVAFTLGVVIPIVIGWLAITFYPALGKVVNAMNTETFLRLQHMRAAFGLMFFFTAALPMWFKYVGGLGDIAAGIGAFFALQYYRQHPDQERRAIIMGNLAGILDFIIVISLGVFVVLQTQSPDIMFDLIPLYVVPMFILLHVYSLKRLGRVGQA